MNTRCDSRLTIPIHNRASISRKTFVYSRPRENTVYISPTMALTRNTSTIHVAIACHLLSGCNGLLATHIESTLPSTLKTVTNTSVPTITTDDVIIVSHPLPYYESRVFSLMNTMKAYRVAVSPSLRSSQFSVKNDALVVRTGD